MNQNAERTPNDLFSIAPIITTERLLLRPHHLNDLPDMFEMWSDPEIVKFITKVPSTFGATWLRMLQYAGHWQHLNYGYWAVVRQSDNQFLGEAGLANFRRGLSPKLLDIPEVGWCIAAPHQGQAYAGEAVRAALKWADAQVDLERTVCLIQPENTISVSLAEKLGFAFLEQVTRTEEPLTIFSRTASERSND